MDEQRTHFVVDLHLKTKGLSQRVEFMLDVSDWGRFLEMSSDLLVEDISKCVQMFMMCSGCGECEMISDPQSSAVGEYGWASAAMKGHPGSSVEAGCDAGVQVAMPLVARLPWEDSETQTKLKKISSLVFDMEEVVPQLRTILLRYRMKESGNLLEKTLRLLQRLSKLGRDEVGADSEVFQDKKSDQILSRRQMPEAKGSAYAVDDYTEPMSPVFYKLQCQDTTSSYTASQSSGLEDRRNGEMSNRKVITESYLEMNAATGKDKKGLRARRSVTTNLVIPPRANNQTPRSPKLSGRAKWSHFDLDCSDRDGAVLQDRKSSSTGTRNLYSRQVSSESSDGENEASLPSLLQGTSLLQCVRGNHASAGLPENSAAGEDHETLASATSPADPISSQIGADQNLSKLHHRKSLSFRLRNLTPVSLPRTFSPPGMSDGSEDEADLPSLWQAVPSLECIGTNFASGGLSGASAAGEDHETLASTTSQAAPVSLQIGAEQNLSKLNHRKSSSFRLRNLTPVSLPRTFSPSSMSDGNEDEADLPSLWQAVPSIECIGTNFASGGLSGAGAAVLEPLASAKDVCTPKVPSRRNSAASST
eukprot:TRINITY_DN14898_c0_g1_i1.p1 TRINITY_DN14898_c0_g1~~TRINITY_DN14898_c0_g1_i1.p1  ORF type:complete len:606 (+),score=72.37 TRINITY_DN14898_c0_g1_i1:49-1818(+)